MKSNRVTRRTALECLLGQAAGPGMSTKSLQDAARAINRAGGTIEADWPLDRAIEVGDKATQCKTLMELYSRMASNPAAVDLPDRWKQLGVVRDDRHVTFDNGAPLASIRASIVA